MGKGLSLAGLITAIFGAFVPFVGLFIGWIALVFATFGALSGGKGLAIATVAVSTVVFLFMTPSLWVEAAGQAAGFHRDTGTSPIFRITTLFLLAAPIVGCVIGKREAA